MTITQIPSLVIDAVGEALGTTALSTLDTTSVVSLGAALSTSNLYDKFYGSLLDRMIKTEYMIKMYKRKNRQVIRDEAEYGAFIQRVYYGTINPVDDPTYAIPDSQGDYAQHSPYDIEGTIPVTSLVYGVKGVWSYEFIRPIESIKTAFLSNAEMSAFLSGLQIEVENEIESAMEALESAAVNTAIAVSLDSNKATVKRNLLAEYNTAHPSATLATVDAALESPDFHRFAVKAIRKTLGLIKHRSTAYNVNGYRTFTEDPIIEMLTEFVSNNEIYLGSDSFNKELISYDNFSSIDYWQKQGESFADASSIDIAHDDLSNDVTQSGIVCVIRDREGVAAKFGNRRSYQQFNPRDEIMIQMEKAAEGYIADKNMNCVVFYLAVPVSQQ